MPRLRKCVCQQNNSQVNSEIGEDALTNDQFRRVHLLVHASVKFCSSQHALYTVASALLTKLHLHYSMVDGLPRQLPPKHVQLPM